MPAARHGLGRGGEIMHEAVGKSARPNRRVNEIVVEPHVGPLDRMLALFILGLIVSLIVAYQLSDYLVATFILER